MPIKKIFNQRNLIIAVLATFMLSVIYSIVRIILAPNIVPSFNVTVRVKSDYVLMLVQCMLGIFAMTIPSILKHKIRLNIPPVMITVYAVFLYCAIYLGEVRNFYFVIPYWDTILHIFSSAALCLLGFTIVNILNDSGNIFFSLSPGFLALFAFCFALSLGVLWEIYEFSVDYFLHTNMQKYALETGERLIGQQALFDTMKDFIVDALGALAISLLGYIALKYRKGKVKYFQIEKM